MPDKAYCFLGGIVSLMVILTMFYLVFGPGRSPPIFRSVDDVYAGWRSARTPGERLLFLGLFYRHLRGPFFVLALAPFAGVVASVGTSICGLDPEALRIIRGTIGDILDFFRELRSHRAESA